VASSQEPSRIHRPRTAGLRRGILVSRLLIAVDVVALTSAFAILQLSPGSGSGANRIEPGAEWLLFVLCVAAWIVLAHSWGMYRRDEERPGHTTVDDLVGVVLLVTLLAWGAIAVSTVTPLASPDTQKWVLFWLLAIALVASGRSAARVVAHRLPGYVQRTVVVGAGKTGQLIARKLTQHAEYGLDVIGFVDGRPRNLRADVAHLPILGTAEDLLSIVEQNDVARVVVTATDSVEQGLEDIVRHLQAIGVRTDVAPRLLSVLGPNIGLTSIEGMQLVTIPPARMSGAALAAKRVFDLVLASLTVALLAPLFLVISVLIRGGSAGPAFFRQTRLGIDERPFTFLKFRTMTIDTTPEAHRAYVRSVASEDAVPEAHGLFKLDQGAKVTRVGRWLRKTSLDELPQLLNVIRGEMSLVGPRPCIPYELEHFAPHHFERFTVPAGMTGLWQVTARAHSTFTEALDLDVAYARSRSFGLDLRLLLQTPLHMMRRRSTQ
jgi:exopolysaccharide biosynthesis polyprenyl glycosylphosphotransferase